MGTIYNKNKIRLSLYDKSQHHGHDVSHIHVKDHDESFWIDAEGNIVEGSSKNMKKIIKWIKDNQVEIKDRLVKLAAGEEITIIDKDM